MKKKIPACVDVPGRKVTWLTESGSRMYGETIKCYLESIPAKKPAYPKQRELTRRIIVVANDGRIFDIAADQDNLKKIKMVAE